MPNEDLNESNSSPVQASESKAIRVALKNLLLDPNNYRFIDHMDYQRVELSKLHEADIQRRTTGFILGKNQENVRDLVDSLKKNGWLPVDQIQVHRLDSGKYVVVEGNRRVATLKHLQSKYDNESADLGALDSAIFSGIPVVMYSEPSPAHHLVLMGLKHISGNKKWPALNQAQLLKTLFQEHNLSPDEICKRLGIYKKTFTTALKTLDLCEKYRGSEYGDQFRSDKFSIFQEVVKSPALRKWLGWSEVADLPQHTENLQRLFSWLSYEQDIDSESEELSDLPAREPIVTTAAQIRELGKIISDPMAIEKLEKTKSLSDATLSSEIFVKSRVEGGLSDVEQGVNLLFNHLEYLDEEALARVDDIRRKIDGLTAAGEAAPKIIRRDVANRVAPSSNGSFSSIHIHHYKRFDEVAFSEFSKINIFAGPNNCGKTTLLEAIYLFSQQASIDALLEVIRWRGKIYEDLDPRWLCQQTSSSISLSGKFSGMSCALQGRVHKEDEIAQQRAFYLKSIILESRCGDVACKSITRLFENSDRKTETTSDSILCRAAFSSPFALAERGALRIANQHSIELNVKRRIVEFIRKHFDGMIDAIELVDSFDRFLVTQKDGRRAFDLSDFGEGLQRVFHIGLQASLARDGILLVDEIDNAIHTTLLDHLVDLLVDLSLELNIQLFLTSHSKECIDAFIRNPRARQLISGYGLSVTPEGNVNASRLSGNELFRLGELMDADLRKAK